MQWICETRSLFQIKNNFPIWPQLTVQIRLRYMTCSYCFWCIKKGEDPNNYQLIKGVDKQKSKTMKRKAGFFLGGKIKEINFSQKGICCLEHGAVTLSGSGRANWKTRNITTSPSWESHYCVEFLDFFGRKIEAPIRHTTSNSAAAGTAIKEARSFRSTVNIVGGISFHIAEEGPCTDTDLGRHLYPPPASLSLSFPLIIHFHLAQHTHTHTHTHSRGSLLLLVRQNRSLFQHKRKVQIEIQAHPRGFKQESLPTFHWLIYPWRGYEVAASWCHSRPIHRPKRWPAPWMGGGDHHCVFT